MRLEKLRALREDRDLSQIELAKMVHISQRCYSHYEVGDRGIPLEILMKLADIFGVPLDELLDRDSSTERHNPKEKYVDVKNNNSKVAEAKGGLNAVDCKKTKNKKTKSTAKPK